MKRKWPPKIGTIVTMSGRDYVVTSTVWHRAFGRLVFEKSFAPNKEPKLPIEEETSLVKDLTEVKGEEDNVEEK